MNRLAKDEAAANTNFKQQQHQQQQQRLDSAMTASHNSKTALKQQDRVHHIVKLILGQSQQTGHNAPKNAIHVWSG